MSGPSTPTAAGGRSPTCVWRRTTGLVGWAEYSESTWSPGLTGVIEALAPFVLDRDPQAFARLSGDLRALTRMTRRWDRGPGDRRDRERVHRPRRQGRGPPRVRAVRRPGARPRPRVLVALRLVPRHARGSCSGRRRSTAIEGWVALGARGPRAGLHGREDEPGPLRARTARSSPTRGSLPGSSPRAVPGDEVIVAARAQLEALREGAGPGVDLMLDLNFSVRGEGLVRFGRALDDLELAWLEVDLQEPAALADARSRIATPIASCEALYGVLGFRPYLQARAADVVIVDVPWNGLCESLRIAALADALRGQRRPAQLLRPPGDAHEPALRGRHPEPADPRAGGRRRALARRPRRPTPRSSATATPRFPAGPAGGVT